MKWIWSICILGFGLVYSGCNSNTQTSPKITIAVASNFRQVLDSIILLYQSEYDIDINVVGGSSGFLTNQILHGAPYDIFFSADVGYPKIIQEELGLAFASKIYALGYVMYVKRPNTLLNESATPVVGMANPQVAPYGSVALKIAKQYSLNHKIIFQDNVALVLAHLKAGTLNSAWIPSSYITQIANQDFEIQTFEKTEYQLQQAYVCLKNNQDISNFTSFFHSQKVQKIIESYHYHIPPIK